MSYHKAIIVTPPTGRLDLSAKPGLGDWLSDLMNALGMGTPTPPASPDSPTVPGGDIGSGEGTTTSSSGTTQDTGVTAGGGTIGGQDTGVPTAPTAAWQNVGGVCYATTTGGLLDSFKELQRQLNRVATVQNWALIGVDGAIGPATMAMINQVSGLGAYNNVGFAATSASCDTVASNVFALIGATQSYADSQGVSGSVSSPSGSPQVWNPTTGALQPQGVVGSVGDVWGNLSTTTQLLVGAGAIGVLLYATKTGKKAAAASRARAATSRRTSRRY